MYGTDTVLSLLLLVSAKLKISRAKVETHFLTKCFCNQQMFGTRYFQKMPKDNRKQYADSYVHKLSYYLVYSKKYPSK